MKSQSQTLPFAISENSASVITTSDGPSKDSIKELGANFLYHPSSWRRAMAQGGKTRAENNVLDRNPNDLQIPGIKRPPEKVFWTFTSRGANHFGATPPPLRSSNLQVKIQELKPWHTAFSCHFPESTVPNRSG